MFHSICPKWLLTQHFKNVHDLMVKKAKLNCPSTCEGGPSLRPHLDEFTDYKPCACDPMAKWPKGDYLNLHKGPCGVGTPLVTCKKEI